MKKGHFSLQDGIPLEFCKNYEVVLANHHWFSSGLATPISGDPVEPDPFNK